MAWYDVVLAGVHNERFTAFAEAAALSAMRLLPPAADCGPIVDLGCGSGVTASRLSEAGYDVRGVDVSPTMIELAQQNAPQAHFELASVYDVGIPDCQAVLAIGEIFNYATADRTDERLDALWSRIGDALAPDGFLLFDVAGPGRAQATPAEWIIDTDEWTMWTRAAEDPELSSLTRRIVTFARSGSSYQRHDETHVLELLEDDDVRPRLERAGFAAERIPGYEGLDLNPGWSVWLARKTAAHSDRK